MAVVDPQLTMGQPAMVTAAAGMDILCHALESWTARWFADFDAKTPEQRVPYCGANPIADLWAQRAMSLLAGSFRRAVADGGDVEARAQMALAATVAGLGFGNAGVHVPHANAYPIAGRVRDYRPEGYPDGSNMEDLHREAFRECLGMGYAQFDIAWAEWVRANYSSQ